MNFLGVDLYNSYDWKFHEKGTSNGGLRLLMGKAIIKIPVIIVLTFIIISILFLVLPCKAVQFAGGFFGSTCSTGILFVLINLPGALILYLVFHTEAIYKSLELSIITILIDSLIYFFVIYLVTKLFSRRK
ncbi:MAG: hypothetical protein NT076_05360 [Candidatus Pacearchaeota archaeon]|nr:hypothetical protein [Candidatus Pacearchaeota archaeon]